MRLPPSRRHLSGRRAIGEVEIKSQLSLSLRLALYMGAIRYVRPGHTVFGKVTRPPFVAPDAGRKASGGRARNQNTGTTPFLFENASHRM